MYDPCTCEDYDNDHPDLEDFSSDYDVVEDEESLDMESLGLCNGDFMYP